MPLRLAPEPLNIGPLDGFSNSDIFEAEATGERLANVIAAIEGHSVIVLDGPWGTGKSVFVRQWAGLLRNRGHPVVYFDAFAHDHLEDAFFPLLGQFLRARNATGSPLEQLRDTFIDKATPLVQTIPALLADVAVRTATGGIFSSKDIRETWEQSKAAEKGRARIMIEECLGRVDEHMECAREFRRELERAVAGIDEEDSKSPMVFIIDELDRCRPTYALSILERMKHIFAANGVCFVLVTHLTELTAMVQRAYGLINAPSYLEKFYHRRFDFERLLVRGSERLRRRYLDHLAAGFRIERDPSGFATITIDNLTRIHNVSLRGQERIMVNYALFRSAMPTSPSGHSSGSGFQFEVAPGLAAMRHIDKDLFDLASAQNLRFSDASEFLKIDQWIDISQDGQRLVERWWRMGTVDGFEDLTDEEKARIHPDCGLDDWRQLLANACSAIDQLGN